MSEVESEEFESDLDLREESATFGHMPLADDVQAPHSNSSFARHAACGIFDSMSSTDEDDEDIDDEDEDDDDDDDDDGLGLRQCWICYAAGFVEDPYSEWRSPCECRGSSRWVHEECLLRWIDERQKGQAPDSIVACPQCKVSYKLRLPPPTILEHILDQVDGFASSVCPPLAVMAVGGSLLYCSYKYGQVCVRVMVDSQGMEELLSSTEPIYSSAFMTVLPIALLGVGRWNLEGRFATCVRWVMQAMRSHVGGLLRTVGVSTSNQKSVSSGEEALEEQRILPPPPAPNPAAHEVVVDGSAMSSFLVSSLSLPFLASLFGRLFFSNLPRNSPKRTICGGLLYLAVKGGATAYLETCHESRLRHRTILDCTTPI